MGSGQAGEAEWKVAKDGGEGVAALLSEGGSGEDVRDAGWVVVLAVGVGMMSLSYRQCITLRFGSHIGTSCRRGGGVGSRRDQ